MENVQNSEMSDNLDSKYHILVVDDDTKIRLLLTRYLSSNDYYVSVAKDAQEAREVMQELKFDIIILDVMMPGETGVSFVNSLRKLSNVPVILLTAMGEVDDRINGLEKGADDYLVKPFEPKELLLRIKRILQRSSSAKLQKAEFVFGKFVYDIKKNLFVKQDGSFVKLTTSEIKLFNYLLNNLGSSVSREVLSKECGVNERSIDVQIIRIRSKIEPEPKQPIYLQTIRGKGYILYQE